MNLRRPVTSTSKTSKELTVKIKAVASGAALATTAALAVAIAGVAQGSSPHPYQYTDTTGNAKGGLSFYDASGNAITSGSTSNPIAAYVKGAGVLRAGDTTASLYVYSPTGSAVSTTVTPVGAGVSAADWSAFVNQPNQPGAWSGQLLAVSSASGSFPGALSGAAAPIVTVDSDSWSVGDITADFAHTGDDTDVQGIYELRLKTGASGISTTAQYDSAFIKVSGGTWQLFDTATDNSGGGGGSNTDQAPSTTVTKTTPTVTAVPSAAKTSYGKAFSVTVSVAAAGTSVSGSVTLTSGATSLGSGTLLQGAATFTVAGKTLSPGAKTLTASYSGSAALNPATGTTTVTITKATSATTIKLAKPTVKKSTRATATVKVTASGVSAVTGSVKIYDGKKALKTVTLAAKNKGALKVTLPKISKTGVHKLKAVYVASANVATSTSKTVNLKVTK